MTPGTSKYFDKVKHFPESKDRVKKLLNYIDDMNKGFITTAVIILGTGAGIFVNSLVDVEALGLLIIGGSFALSWFAGVKLTKNRKVDETVTTIRQWWAS